MRTIGVVSTSRADYGIYKPLLHAIQSDQELDLYLMVTGMHLDKRFGQTAQLIETDGFTIHERIETLISADTPSAIAKSMGMGMVGFGQSFARFRPDILLVLGDRYEMFVAALAALPFNIPVAHIHGGELTEGAIDDALRHSLTKLSHLHFVATPAYANRVMQLGEAPWRVTVTGALSLENLRKMKFKTPEQLESKFKLDLSTAPILITFHPVTLDYARAQWQIEQLLSALENYEFPLIFTLPNADTHGDQIRAKIEYFAQTRQNAFAVENFGTHAYFSLMKIARIMIGNSSSGIIEAPSFGLPVVNIGTRQLGRIRDKNVIDVGYHKEEITAGIDHALSDEFGKQLQDMENLYYQGSSSAIIIKKLKQANLDKAMITKHFYDLDLEISLES